MSTDQRPQLQSFADALNVFQGSVGMLKLAGLCPNNQTAIMSPQTQRTAWKVALKPVIVQNNSEAKKCAVCGSGHAFYHYGAYSCEGCRAFFKRTVLAPERLLTCVRGSHCQVDARARSRCRYCRWKKCLKVGMLRDG
ncbi:unnamed protein product, partial [Mesorhabditis spiculigera]